MNITACAATNCVEDPVPLGGAEMMPTDGEVVDVIIGRLVWRVLGLVTDSTERLELVHIALVKTSWYPKKALRGYNR
ncbi:19896_t:CDS:2 [Rhizophagus irregularis]|nr:19896_t:CDS:2 [Rhizophagus irregularis]